MMLFLLSVRLLSSKVWIIILQNLYLLPIFFSNYFNSFPLINIPSGFEIPKAIVLKGELFTLESGLLTPTMKLKRNVAGSHFEKEIQGMYDKILGKQQSSKL